MIGYVNNGKTDYELVRIIFKEYIDCLNTIVDTNTKVNKHIIEESLVILEDTVNKEESIGWTINRFNSICTSISNELETYTGLLTDLALDSTLSKEDKKKKISDFKEAMKILEHTKIIVEQFIEVLEDKRDYKEHLEFVKREISKYKETVDGGMNNFSVMSSSFGNLFK